MNNEEFEEAIPPQKSIASDLNESFYEQHVLSEITTSPRRFDFVILNEIPEDWLYGFISKKGFHEFRLITENSEALLVEDKNQRQV